MRVEVPYIIRVPCVYILQRKGVRIQSRSAHTACILTSVGSAYAMEKRKSDQPGLVAHTKHTGDYCRGVTAHVIHSTL